MPFPLADFIVTLLKAYLQIAPGARPHIEVGRNAPLEEFEKIAAKYPVFKVNPNTESN